MLEYYVKSWARRSLVVAFAAIRLKGPRF